MWPDRVSNPGFFFIFRNGYWIPLHRMMDITEDKIVKWHSIMLCDSKGDTE